MASGRNRSFQGGFGAVALLGIGHAVLAVACAKLFYSGHEAAGLWLANAFATGVILRAGFGSLTLPVLVIIAASIVSNFALGHALEDVILFSATNSISVLVAVLLLRGRFRDVGEIMSNPANYVTALALAGAVAPGVAGLLYAQASFHLTGDPLILTWWLWTSGDALGYAVVLPLALSLTHNALAEFCRPKPVLGFAVALFCVALAAAAGMTWTNFPFVLLLVPLIVSAAFLPAFMLATVAAFAVLVVLGAAASEFMPSAIAEALESYRFQVSLAICAVLPMLGQMMIEQMRKDRHRVLESEQRFRRAMKDSAIGVAIVALDGKIVETNNAFAEMLGYTTAELETKSFPEITYPEDQALGEDTMRAVRAGEADSYRFEKRYLRKNGTPVWGQLAGSVIRDQNGKPLYLVSQIEDIDARKTSEAALEDAETRWNFALGAAGQGFWDLDVRKGEVHYSSTWKAMLGYEEHELDGDPDQWLTMIHPDDRARVDQADKDHIAGKTPTFEAEFRMRHKEGHYLWILDRGQIVERDADGAMLRAIGTLTDITMRREAEERLVSYTSMLADEKERLRVTLNSIGDAVICTDAENRVTFMNPVAESLTRVSENAALNKPLAHIYRSVDEETGERLAITETAGDRSNNRAVLVRADGSRCSIREVVSAIETEKGTFGGSVIVFQDFTDARTLQRELAYAAAHDALTGLANRSAFIQKMETLVASRTGDAADSHFLFIDLDHFKAVNDTAGHAAGDALLKRVADAIATLARPGDIVARLGGDEFAAVLKNCTVREAEAIANRIVGAVGTLDFNWDGQRFEIGASIGVAALGRDTEIDAVIARADEACYSAKASGRNCVVVFDARSASKRPLVRTFSAAS